MPKIFDVKLVFEQIPALLKYLPVTLEITALSMIFGLILGLLLAIVKIKRIPVLYRISAVFVSFMRGPLSSCSCISHTTVFLSF